MRTVPPLDVALSTGVGTEPAPAPAVSGNWTSCPPFHPYTSARTPDAGPLTATESRPGTAITRSSSPAPAGAGSLLAIDKDVPASSGDPFRTVTRQTAVAPDGNVKPTRVDDSCGSPATGPPASSVGCRASGGVT